MPRTSNNIQLKSSRFNLQRSFIYFFNLLSILVDSFLLLPTYILKRNHTKAGKILDLNNVINKIYYNILLRLASLVDVENNLLHNAQKIYPKLLELDNNKQVLIYEKYFYKTLYTNNMGKDILFHEFKFLGYAKILEKYLNEELSKYELKIVWTSGEKLGRVETIDPQIRTLDEFDKDSSFYYFALPSIFNNLISSTKKGFLGIIGVLLSVVTLIYYILKLMYFILWWE